MDADTNDSVPGIHAGELALNGVVKTDDLQTAIINKVFYTLLFVPLCLGYISQLVDSVVGHFCITFLSFAIYTVLCL